MDKDIDLIIESLQYAKRKYEDIPIQGPYPQTSSYPSYDFKMKKIKRIENCIKRLKKYKKGE